MPEVFGCMLCAPFGSYLPLLDRLARQFDFHINPREEEVPQPRKSYACAPPMIRRQIGTGICTKLHGGRHQRDVREHSTPCVWPTLVSVSQGRAGERSVTRRTAFAASMAGCAPLHPPYGRSQRPPKVGTSHNSPLASASRSTFSTRAL